ncbi:MAG: enoyl-CoA hydratase-related protein [Granulosicoccus sp.]
MTFETIKTRLSGPVGILTLHRPDALNALSSTMMSEVREVIEGWDADQGVRAIILTGSEKAFAAGADINEMVDQNYLDAFESGFLNDWNCISNCRTPIIAAVAGYALGGGCEVAMMCDFILAADNARFGQPEIKIGIIPGLGGTQRLTRLVGKSKAMEMCLTGRMIDAQEAERSGLVSRVVPLAELADEALLVATSIAGLSRSPILLAKECVDSAMSTTLEEGLQVERQAFLSLLGTTDQREGMLAFSEKRAAKFTR